VLRRQLEVLGFAVSTAEQGRQALDRYGNELSAFALVLLDVTMPVLGGKETLRQMKGRCPRLPVILCSGYEEDAAGPAHDGVVPDGTLTKPVLLDTLRDVVRDTLRASAGPAARATDS
jgi:two-component system cell cycle sensor histidine kinase/response regulator CckA